MQDIERRRQKAEAEKKRYAMIKNDPVLCEKQKEKERLKYQKKLQKRQIKPVAEMSEREHRRKMKQWRSNSKAYYDRKKTRNEATEGEETKDGSSSTSTASNSHSELSRQQQHLQNLAKQRRRKNQNRVVRDNTKLKAKIQQLEKKVKTLQKREQRSKSRELVNNNDPRSRVDRIMKEGDKKVISKKLLLSESLIDTLKLEYKEKNRRLIKNLLVKHMKSLKRYKLLNQYNCLSPKLFSKRSVFKCRDFRMKKITAAVQQDVKMFFESDDVSRMCPGKKDCVTVKKVKKQKRLLLDSLKNLHAKFCESSSYKIGYSTFCTLRPFWVRIPTVNERETCACKIHENIKFLVLAMYNAGVINKKDPKELSSYLCCDKNAVACLTRSCSECKGSLIPYMDFHQNEPLCYEQWKTVNEEYISKGKARTVKRTVKVRIQSTIVDCIDLLETEMIRYMKHEGTYIHQFRQIEGLKLRISENEVLIHCDFSENYESKYAAEIQTCHFGGSKKQFSLHTVIVYYRPDAYSPVQCKSICSLSECNDHTAPAVWAHLQPIFEFVKEVSPQVKVVHFLSDSPSSQYRNKIIFYLLSHALKPALPTVDAATWNFTAPGHGKGAVDGVGGCLKRTADKAVARGADISNFEDFIKTLECLVRGVKLYIVKESDVTAIKNMLPDNIKSFDGTMKVHQVVYVNDNLTMKTLSCLTCIDCLKFFLGTLTYVSDTEVHSDDDDDSVELQQLLNVQIDELQPDLTSDNFQNEPDLDVDVQGARSAPNYKVMGTIDDAIIEVGEFFLVKFDGEKSDQEYRYVCQMKQVSPELTVTGFRSFRGSKREFVICERDECIIEKQDIISFLPKLGDRKEKRRTIVMFSHAVDVKEK